MRYRLSFEWPELHSHDVLFWVQLLVAKCLCSLCTCSMSLSLLSGRPRVLFECDTGE